MRCCRWVKNPLCPGLHKLCHQPVHINQCSSFLQFTRCAYKIGASITNELQWQSLSSGEIADRENTRVCRKTMRNLDVYSSGSEAGENHPPAFFGSSPDCYYHRSEVVDPGGQIWTFINVFPSYRLQSDALLEHGP
ncbi:uncharacterized protein LOC120906073 [Anopheles arabiensis]|uniref:uncharacterized protein LOC120906073 n=1 Tax=Anopheles arabiensis TaxID=7173 RepID=UPI001AAD9477|nr:uncharacterized protein LOC120906073 [Anopheles arabiensis]